MVDIYVTDGQNCKYNEGMADTSQFRTFVSYRQTVEEMFLLHIYLLTDHNSKLSLEHKLHRVSEVSFD